MSRSEAAASPPVASSTRALSHVPITASVSRGCRACPSHVPLSASLTGPGSNAPRTALATALAAGSSTAAPSIARASGRALVASVSTIAMTSALPVLARDVFDAFDLPVGRRVGFEADLLASNRDLLRDVLGHEDLSDANALGGLHPGGPRHDLFLGADHLRALALARAAVRLRVRGR